MISEKFKTYDSDKKYVFDGQANVKKYDILLILYFGPDNDKENEFIVYLVEDIIKKLTSGDALFKGQDLIIIDMINYLKNALRAYYKVEWKRANGSYNNDEVNEKLNNEEIYKHVKVKYEVLFMNNSDPNFYLYGVVDNFN